MQETVQWQPLSDGPRLPWESRYYILFLFLGVGFSLVRAFGLLRQIGFLRFTKRNREITGDSLALDAFSYTLPKEFALVRSFLDQAESKFTYLYEISGSKIQQLRQFANLNIFLGRVVALMLFVNEIDEIITTKITHTFFVLSLAEQVLTPFIFGLIVSGAIYAFCIFYEGILARRRISWNYFCSRAESLNS